MSRNSCKDNNMSGVFLAENRKRSLDEIDLAEEDYLELIADEILGSCGS